VCAIVFIQKRVSIFKEFDRKFKNENLKTSPDSDMKLQEIEIDKQCRLFLVLNKKNLILGTIVKNV